MKKFSLYITLAIMALAGFCSCDEELAQPPVILPEGGIGTGAWDNPMTAWQAHLGSVSDVFSTPWVKGYIVGYIDIDIANVAKEETVKFSAPATVNTNIVIAPTPDCRDWSQTVPVQLPSGAVRNALNLSSNPGNLGRLVCVQGTTGSKYCSAYGVRSVIAYNFGETGIEGTDNPVTPDNPGNTPAGSVTVYSALDGSAAEITEGWTYDNVNLASGLSYVWSWKDYNGSHYLNGSAYLNGTALASESYAVSPVIDLTGYSKVTASFEHAAKFQTTLKELCGFVVRESGSKEWKQIPVANWPGTSSWAFVNSGVLDLSAFDGKKVQVAFKYGSSSAGADTWEIKSLIISGVK